MQYPHPDGWLGSIAPRYPELAFDYIYVDIQGLYAGRTVIRLGQVVHADWRGPDWSEDSWDEAVRIWGDEITRWEAEVGWSDGAEQLTRPCDDASGRIP